MNAGAALRRALTGGRRVLTLIGALALLTVATPLTRICGHRLAGPIVEPRAPVLIVLAAANSAGDLLSESSYWRSVYAVRAWRSGAFERILIAGDRSSAMQHFLISEGVPPAKVDVENRSRTTRENALYVAEMLAARRSPSPVLMTSDYHMYRARRCFEKVGLTVLPRPIPDAIKRGAAWYNRPAVLAAEIAEFAKIVYYRARGWI